MFAPLLVAWAVAAHSWRLAFVAAGALGLVWALAWLAWYPSPDKHPRLSAQERAHIEAGQERHLAARGKRGAFVDLAKRREVWGIALPRMFADPAWGMLSFWMPLYLARERGFDLAHIAMFAWLPFLAADLGCLFGPALVGFLQRRGVHLIDARRWAFTLGAALMIGMAFVGMACQDMSGRAMPADFAFWRYVGREDV